MWICRTDLRSSLCNDSDQVNITVSITLLVTIQLNIQRSLLRYGFKLKKLIVQTTDWLAYWLVAFQILPGFLAWFDKLSTNILFRIFVQCVPWTSITDRWSSVQTATSGSIVVSINGLVYRLQPVVPLW